MNILVVDPSQTMRRILINALSEKGNNIFYEASDSGQALDILKVSEVDVVITELDLPDMTGLSLTKAIKRSDTFKNISVVMVSSRGSKLVVLEALKAQVDGFIVKPFAKSVLRNKVDEAYNKKKNMSLYTSVADRNDKISKFQNKEINNTESNYGENIIPDVENSE